MWAKECWGVKNATPAAAIDRMQLISLGQATKCRPRTLILAPFSSLSPLIPLHPG